MKKKAMSSTRLKYLLAYVLSNKTSGGAFKQIKKMPDGQEITFNFSQATGMGSGSMEGSYGRKFGTKPTWLEYFHPYHRFRICSFAIEKEQELPLKMDKKTLINWLSIYFDDTNNFLEKMKANLQIESFDSSQEVITIFDVDDDGVLSMTDFIEPELRSDYYDYVASFWSNSPEDLAVAMEECRPLAWAIYEIYTNFRTEIVSELDSHLITQGKKNSRADALTLRLNSMPGEPEVGAINWLLSLTQSEFQNYIVNDISKWFDSPPNWNFEDDYISKESTAHGAAFEFLRTKSSDDLDSLKISITEGTQPGNNYSFAKIEMQITAANKTARVRKIPIRFLKAKNSK